ncbi:MAG TPA: vanadium-dependent haloperoxidase [Flavisolibacter sp.]
MKAVKIVSFLVFTSSLAFSSCQKELAPKGDTAQTDAAKREQMGHLKQTNTYSSEVATKWMDLQLRLMASTSGVANVAFARQQAYSGIGLYEAVVNGMPAYQSIASQLTGLSGLPTTNPGMAYHWAEVANATLAAINKHMFPAASAATKAAIDSLENALKAQYSSETSADIFARSEEYGKTVAQTIIDWSETDGYLHASDTYTAPSGPGLWVPPTNPVPKTSTPYWGNLRVMVAGSGNNAQPGPPTAYSESPSSDFYKMVQQVYTASQNLTTAETNMALYWRDVPGVTTPGHYVSILKQVIQTTNASLDKAAIGYALSGIVVYDAAISCWQTKYQYNLVRPITYIRNVLGHTTWSPLLATPAHPEYSSAHAVLSSADAEAMTAVFGDLPFTDHTYDYLGMPSRSFNSFRDFGLEAGNSRIYAGIHYQPSINAGLRQGRKVAENIISSLKFLKQ